MIVRRIIFSFILILLLGGTAVMSAASAASSEISSLAYEIKWLDRLSESLIQDEALDPRGWESVPASSAMSKKPAGKNAFIVRFTLPKLADGSGILLDGLSGKQFKVLQRNIPLYVYTAAGGYPYHRILIPLHASESDEMLYVYGMSMNGKIGIGKSPLIGPYDELSSRYTRADLPSMTLGVTLLLVAAVMLICSLFLTREQLRNWLSLSIKVLSIGVMIVLNCPFPYLFFGDYAALYGIMAASAIYICLPASAYFFEHMLESAWRPIIRYWRIVMTLYSAAGITAALGDKWTDGGLVRVTALLTGHLQNAFILVTVFVIAAHCMRSAWQRNREAIIICIGLGLAIAVGVAEISCLSGTVKPFDLLVWEWPITGFVFHLIVLLSKRYVKEHSQAASYIRELELFQQQLNESEQREAASHLAASVAHEVRNPLSVTRGFLQLMTYKTASEKEPLQVALQELDHAHDVITNYLKYAKPETDDIKGIDMNELLREALTILNPLLLAQGVTIDFQPDKPLHIRGRVSQLKQALITILKQRVHSLAGTGTIGLQAYEEEGNAVIRITDDAKPFITTPLIMPEIPLANQITDAGLLFAMRSIEAMNGKIVMKKKKGGSELVIRLRVERD